jgi:DNA-binding NarL/FixJ family response regulator
MPEMNGGQVAAELKRIKPETRIMMLSADIDLPNGISSLVDVRAVKDTSPIAFLSGIQQLLSC